MNRGEQESHQTLGFYTVLEHEHLGYVGGYLLLNAAGRPLEFHCTAPLKPSRSQQILFGPTLDAYLYGEQIGQTLLGKAEPAASVYTDVELALAVRDYVSMPVALVLAAEDGAASPAPAASDWRVDTRRRRTRSLRSFSCGRNHLAVPEERPADVETITARLESLAQFDLHEPFTRIREAVAEAQRCARV